MNYSPEFQKVSAQTLTNYLFVLYFDGEKEAKKVEERMKRSLYSYHADKRKREP